MFYWMLYEKRGSTPTLSCQGTFPHYYLPRKLFNAKKSSQKKKKKPQIRRFKPGLHVMFGLGFFGMNTTELQICRLHVRIPVLKKKYCSSRLRCYKHFNLGIVSLPKLSCSIVRWFLGGWVLFVCFSWVGQAACSWYLITVISLLQESGFRCCGQPYHVGPCWQQQQGWEVFINRSLICFWGLVMVCCEGKNPKK